MAEKISAYKPKCCSKAMMTKGSALRHERNCLRNPDNKACMTCSYLRKDSIEIEGNIYEGIHLPTYYDEFYYYCELDEIEQQYELKRDCKKWKEKR